MRVRQATRTKNYWPLSFTAGFGWRVHAGRLHLSLGRDRLRISIPVPTMTDSATGLPVTHASWGEIQLCWDRDARRRSLHIPYDIDRVGQTG